MPNLLKIEPARIAAFVTALVGIATAFNLWHPTQAQIGAVRALLAVFGGEYVRSVVSPVAKTVTP